MSTVYGLFHQAYQWAVGSSDPFLLVGTQANLRTAIQEKGKDVFKCKFRVASSVYSAAEYCVKLKDKISLKRLIELGARDAFSEPKYTPILHFYIDCLKEEEPADLEILHLLLDNADVDQEDIGVFRTPLEYLLGLHGPKKVLPWKVIEVLLQKRARITTDWQTSAFQILKRCDDDSGTFFNRSAEDEKTFLSNLVKYLELERKFHPLSESAMTFEEFEFHSQNLNRLFSFSPSCINISVYVSSAATAFLRDPEVFASLTADKRELFFSMTESVHRAEVHNQSVQAEQMIKALSQYYYYFETLCSEGTFKDCFSPEQLEILATAFKNTTPGVVSAKRTQELIASLGLSE